MISFRLVKHLIFFLTLFSYFLSSEETEEIYKGLVRMFYISIPGIPVLYITGLNEIIFNRLWDKPLIPLVYALGFIGLYHILIKKTGKENYSFTMAVFMTLSSGWLYEIPLYIKLQGFWGIFRFSKNFFYLDCSILAFILIYFLSYQMNFRKTKTSVISFLFYFIYAYFAYNNWNIGLGYFDLIVYRMIPIIIFSLISNEVVTK